MIKHISHILLFLLLLMLGCATNRLPDSGPSRSDLKSHAKRSEIESLKLVEITSNNIAILGPQRIDSPINTEFKNVFSDKVGHIIGIGDQLLISIWEASS